MECVMLCGIPTSGKSTYVEKLLKLEYWCNSVILSDELISALDKKIEVCDEEKYEYFHLVFS